MKKLLCTIFVLGLMTSVFVAWDGKEGHPGEFDNRPSGPIDDRPMDFGDRGQNGASNDLGGWRDCSFCDQGPTVPESFPPSMFEGDRAPDPFWFPSAHMPAPYEIVD